MFSIYFLQPYGTTTVSPSNFTESNVARANERALKIVKKAQAHSIALSLRPELTKPTMTQLQFHLEHRVRRFRDSCVTILKDLRPRLAVTVAARTRVNIRKNRGSHKPRQSKIKPTGTGTETEQNRGTNRSSPGRLPSTAVILACRALSSMCTVTPRTTTYEPLGSHNKAARGK